MADEVQQAALTATMESGRMLAESWQAMPKQRIRGYEKSKRDKINFLAGIEDPTDKAFLAQLYENSYRWINNMDESTRMVQVGSFEKFVSNEAPLFA